MSATLIKVGNKDVKTTITNNLGVDLNYLPFSSLYANALKDIGDSSELDEGIFLRVLAKLNIIQRVGGKSLPPEYAFESMQGAKGEDRVDFYCKKNSATAKTYSETFGICLDGLTEYRRLHNENVLDLLVKIDKDLASEREDSNDYAKDYKERKGRGSAKTANQKALVMFRIEKEAVLRRYLGGH